MQILRVSCVWSLSCTCATYSPSAADDAQLVIPFAEVVTIEKRMTAYVIPNAISVATLHQRVCGFDR